MQVCAEKFNADDVSPRVKKIDKRQHVIRDSFMLNND